MAYLYADVDVQVGETWNWGATLADSQVFSNLFDYSRFLFSQML